MVDFNEVIDKYLERDSRPKTIGRYYPSESGSCTRKAWYSFMCPVPPEPETLRIFKAGHILHDFMVDVFSSDKAPIKLLQSEVPIKIEFPEFLVSGRIDDLILVLENGELLLVEVKSTTYLPKDEAKREHVMQLQLYLHSMGVRNGVVLYVEKATLQTKAFPIAYDKAAAERVLDRFRTLDRALKSNQLPEPEAKMVREMNWMCNYCDYRDKCDANFSPKEPQALPAAQSACASQPAKAEGEQKTL